MNGERRQDRVKRVGALLRLTSAGQLDAVTASLGSFVIQLLALGHFDAVQLGAYALAYTGIVFGAQVPANLVYVAFELQALKLPEGARHAVLRRSPLAGVPIACLVGALIPIAVLPVVSDVSPSFYWGLVGTAWLAMVLSSIQDHVRRIAHINDRSWVAAGMSVVFLVTAGAGFLSLNNRGSALAPFGVMAVGNLVSLLLGAWMLGIPPRLETALTRRQVTNVGGWILTGGVLEALGSYGILVIIEHLSGVHNIGYIEAARVVSRPVQVMGLGLVAVLGPRLMTAAIERDDRQLRKWRRLYLSVLGVAVVVAVAVIEIPDLMTLLARLVPVAFEVPGLVAISIVTSGLGVANVPLRAHLVGSGRQAAIAQAALISVLAGMIVATSASTIGSVAGPLAAGTIGVVSWILMHRSTKKWVDRSVEPSLDGVDDA